MKHNSPFLKGGYAPVQKEVSHEVTAEGDITGISGVYCRNGPNPHFEPVAKHHWFDGDGMLHAVRFDAANGKVWYANKWVRTQAFLYEASIGRGWFYSLADLSTFWGISGMFIEALREKLFGGVNAMKKVASNTSVIFHDRRLLALVENGAPHWVNATTLDSQGEFDYGGQLQFGRDPFTAHPKIDPLTGEMLTYGYRMNYEKCISYFRVSADGKKSPSVEVALTNNRTIMMHDFAHTKNHVIFLDYPYVFDLSQAMKGGKVFGFRPELGARFGVMRRDAIDDSAVRWFNVDTGFAFHVAASWEKNDVITIILCRAKVFKLEQLGDDKAKRDAVSVLYRYDINLKEPDATKAVVERALSTRGGEFPVIDETNRWGYESRFIWYASFADDGKGFVRIIKHDLNDNKEISYDLEAGCFADEFVFQNLNAVQYKGDYDASKDSVSPDDNGVLMGYVFNSNNNLSELHVLNASTMKLRARVKLNERVPHGFHGKFITQAQLNTERQPNQ